LQPVKTHWVTFKVLFGHFCFCRAAAGAGSYGVTLDVISTPPTRNNVIDSRAAILFAGNKVNGHQNVAIRAPTPLIDKMPVQPTTADLELS
jgi:hypothetical protein